MSGHTEYNDYMQPHDRSNQAKEPKLKLVKERVKPFEGNYTSVYQDYVEHKIGENLMNKKECCYVSPQEKEEMIMESAKRIMEDPIMSKQVFNTLTI